MECNLRPCAGTVCITFILKEKQEKIQIFLVKNDTLSELVFNINVYYNPLGYIFC